MSRLLGAVIAGGQSSRFGSDKAAALWQGVPLIEHVIAQLGPVVDELVICGRDFGGREGIPDRPAAGLGPLGGLNAALHHAVAIGCDAVISAGCDTPLLPVPLLDRLRNATGPAFLGQLPIIGVWPASMAGALDDFLAKDQKHSIKAWGASVSAEAIDWPALPNVNAPGDLAGLG
jgi:molybdopterin-guanine dinucleotide biosynthesis protein A